MNISPIELEVYKNLLSEAAEEMGSTLSRTAFSPNIKERRDYSCAIFNGNGDLAAQALHIPVHLGSMPHSVRHAIQSIELRSGDVAILNDPFRGGTHLPDLTMVTPVITPNEPAPLFYVASRAHHADIGGSSPGSMPLATELFQEGLIIPPVKLMSRGEPVQGIWDMILANVRTPEEREGDLTAQLGALAVGRNRLMELADRRGPEEIRLYTKALMDYSESMTRQTIASLPDGTYSFKDFLDNDGLGSGQIPISVKVTITGDEAVVDFSGSSPQVRGNVNAVEAITLSAVFYVFRSLNEEDIPTNTGGLRPITVIAPEGLIVNARPPAAVAGGNVETSQRLVDTLLGALAQALPDLIPAASSGTMNNLSIGGFDPVRKKPFTYYETIGGGMGASPRGPGLSGVHTHMTNTMNTPIEALEHAYPFQVTRYTLRTDSGGRGRHKGGEGLIREIKLLSEASVTILSDRRELPPYGLAGGRNGSKGRNRLIHSTGREDLPGKVNFTANERDIISIQTPGGGGWGEEDAG
ncbi:MAG: hydantoinase B/oxoprolinase family protein [Deltaproteobacteria bacterium]|nr:hydantoinase B/oxoprolinase family protein [Deltaproteobacteria bacterium]